MEGEYKKIKGIRKLEKREDVYCLVTKNNGNFIANGIVVKNCDSLRYALYTHFFNTSFDSMTAQDLDKLYNEAMGHNPQNLPHQFQQPTNFF